MKNPKQIPVNGRDGLLGWIEPKEQHEENTVLIRLENGALVQVPADLLVVQKDDSYYLPMSRDQFERSGNRRHEEMLVIPVIVEDVEVSKQQETHRVLIHKDVHERVETIDEPGFREEVQVERVPVNRVVDTPPEMRTEGDTMIIPVMEEVLVVEKRLMLKEEVRVTRKHQTVRNPQQVTLRSEEVRVERIPSPSTPNQDEDETDHNDL